MKKFFFFLREELKLIGRAYITALLIVGVPCAVSFLIYKLIEYLIGL
jgi:hypothetical protein